MDAPFAALAETMLRPAPIAAIFWCLAATAAQATPSSSAGLQLLDRLTFGASTTTYAEFERLGFDHWLDQQLRPPASDDLPADAHAEIAALLLSQQSLPDRVRVLDAERRFADALIDPDQRQIARRNYQQQLNNLAKEAATRSLLRDLYSPDQLREVMTWFWLNQFSVHQGKANLRAMVGDYEDAIRAHALGRFRDLVESTLRHPAMLRYLDNAENAVGHLNENYARELMELHTMGVGSGYTQKDVQELARVLTGVGIDLKPEGPRVRPDRAADIVRDGVFEFNPNRHDYGDKTLLGHVIRGRGFAEVEEALDILSRQPATAQRVSQRLAQYFVADDPPPALVAAMAATFRRSDGDIAAVLRTMIRSDAFQASLGKKFKDPLQYALSAVRLAYGDRVILNTGPIQGWLARMGESPYGHETPDGYSLTSEAWDGPGQMALRFEVARQIGTGSAGLFRPLAGGADAPAFPQLQNALYFEALQGAISAQTGVTLSKAVSSGEWNTLFLASPEFMER